MYFVVLWVISVFQEHSSDAFLNVHVCFGCELASDIDLSMSSHCLHGYPRVWILLETGIEYDIGYLVTQFVWVSWADTFGSFKHSNALEK